jgi:hypothetical protein
VWVALVLDLAMQLDVSVCVCETAAVYDTTPCTLMSTDHPAQTCRRHLVSLRLGYNKITNAGAAGFVALAEGTEGSCSSNTTLQYLHLGGNPITFASGIGEARGDKAHNSSMSSLAARDKAWAAALERWPLLFC